MTTNPKMMATIRWMLAILSVCHFTTTSPLVHGFAPTTRKTISSIDVASRRHSFIIKTDLSLSPMKSSPSQKKVSSLHHPMSASSSSTTTRTTALQAETGNDSSAAGEKSSLPFFLDPGTKGGAVFLSLVLFVVPIIFYKIITTVGGVDEIEAGKWIGIGFTVLSTLGWVSTYLFRVATKDMTYAKQLKDYENAVIAKRLEELDDDEIQALQEEVERDQF